jgi:hypothetical protein
MLVVRCMSGNDQSGRVRVGIRAWRSLPGVQVGINSGTEIRSTRRRRAHEKLMQSKATARACPCFLHLRSEHELRLTEIVSIKANRINAEQLPRGVNIAHGCAAAFSRVIGDRNATSVRIRTRLRSFGYGAPVRLCVSCKSFRNGRA